MILHFRARVLLAALAMVLVGGGLTAAPAAAHPLGNFTINHYSGLTLTPDAVRLLAVVDTAEIPTAQQRPEIDLDDDGQLSEDELASAAESRCRELAPSLVAVLNDETLTWQGETQTLVAEPGAAGLDTLRLECSYRADADLTAPAILSFSDTYLPDRLGWREITAAGDGVRIVDAPVPDRSTSDELRTYPEELLSSPLDVDSAVLTLEPGSPDTETSAPVLPALSGTDPLSRLVTAGDRQLSRWLGDDALTPAVGTLAVLLAVLLGAGHSMLPGHGKAVMAAYLAGRRGRRRDAVIVGATVTATHTVGVLVLGLLLSLSAVIAGERVLQVLGVVSGLLIAVVGAWMLRDALRTRRGEAQGAIALASDGHSHSDAHSHSGGHSHSDAHSHSGGHSHGHGHSHGRDASLGRRGLIGLGVAGGLVPSPSALIVLLGAIALGRTVFGVVLVLAYGAGMAVTLTAVGLLLVHLRGRLDRLEEAGSGRAGTVAATATRWLPAATASLVLLVGVGLVLRALLGPG